MCDVIFVQAFSGAVYVFLYEETNLPRSQCSTCGKDRYIVVLVVYAKTRKLGLQLVFRFLNQNRADVRPALLWPAVF
jgi:hypothetical protein